VVSLALMQDLQRRPTDEELQRFLRVLEHALTGFTITLTRITRTTPSPGGSLC
jgi:hypothetical protein